MPATRLQDKVESLSRYDVVGQDGAVPMFVCHVGLASSERSEVRAGNGVAVDHMGPPLERDAEILAHVVGTASLTYGQVNQIKNFVNGHLGERRAQEIDPLRRFVIRPHAEPFRDNNGVTVCMRFSCAGFVIQAYRDAGIDLLDTNEESLLPVKRETLGTVYPLVLRSSWAALNRKYEWGLDENDEESWPVVLPGYVLHALNRKVAEIRDGAYKARFGDEVFPR